MSENLHHLANVASMVRQSERIVQLVAQLPSEQLSHVVDIVTGRELTDQPVEIDMNTLSPRTVLRLCAFLDQHFPNEILV